LYFTAGVLYYYQAGVLYTINSRSALYYQQQECFILSTAGVLYTINSRSALYYQHQKCKTEVQNKSAKQTKKTNEIKRRKKDENNTKKI